MTALLRIGLVLVAGILVFDSGTLQAQACVGLPSLSKAVKLISTTGSGSGMERLVTGRFGMNGQRIFAGVHAGYAAQNDFLDPRDPVLGLDVGYTFQPGGAGGVELCPVVQSMYQRGPNAASYNQSQLTTTAMLGVGRSLRANASFAVSPFIQGGVIQRHYRYTGPYTLVSIGSLPTNPVIASHSTNRLLGNARVGVGLHLGRFLTLTPVMSMPIGAGPQSFYGTGDGWGREATYSLSASFRIPR